MTQLTVRGIDPELHQTLKEKALESGLSVNKYIVMLLKQAAGLKDKDEKPAVYDDLDFLAGTWTEEETEEFNKAIEWTTQIDWEMWK